MANEEKEFVCIQLRNKRWSGKTGLEAEDLGLDPEDVPEIFKLGSKRLCPKDELEPFTTMFNSTRNWLNSISLPFVLKQVRIVARMRLPQIVERLKDDRSKTYDLALEFAKKYPQIKEQWLADHPNQREKLESFYPPANEIVDKFELDWSVFKVSGINAREVDEQALVKAVRDSEKEFKSQCEDMVKESIQIVRGKIAETVKNLSGKIREGKVVRNDSLKSVKNIFDWFQELNVFGDSDVEASLAKLKGYLDGVGDAAFLRDNVKLNQDILALADEVVEKASSIQDIDGIANRYKRVIDLGD